MKQKFSRKFYSTFFALLLVVSLVTTPLSTIVNAESTGDHVEDNENVDVEKHPEDNESIKDSEENGESDTNSNGEDSTQEIDSEASDEMGGAEEEGSESETDSVTNSKQNEPKENLEVNTQKAIVHTYETEDEVGDSEIVEFKHDLVRETVKRELGIESDHITVSDMENLEEFYLNLWESDQKISLKGLEHAVNLRSLVVMNVDLEDTWVLGSLKNLELINFYNTNIEDISVIKDLTQLVGLNIASTNVSDISALENLTKLSFLNLDFTNVSDISVLKNLTKMYSLGLGAPNITDISVLEHLQELNEVALYDTKITDIKVLRKLPKLSNAVLDEIPVEAYDFETLDLLIENDAIIGWDAYQWYISQLEDLFPEDEGFRVDEEMAQVTAHVKEDSYTLSADQLEALKKNNLSIVLEKEDITTSIPVSVFTNYGEVEIKIEELDKFANSFSNAYKFTITQGNKTISEFVEPITLTFKVNMEGANDVNNLHVFYLNETTGKWENIGGTYDANTGTVTADTDHFSTFAVFEAEGIDSDPVPTNPGTPERGDDSSDRKDNSDDETGVIKNDSDTTTNVTTESDSNSATNVTTESDNNSLLPSTATNMYNFLFFGLALLLAGVSIFAIRRFNAKKA